jgi:HNH endonuclease
MKEAPVSIEWLRENVIYEPETGVFLWRKRAMGRTLGRVLGTKNWDGYVIIKVNQTPCYAHRLAWFHFHGEWPKGHIDHIDGNRSNNAIANLRPATAAQNAARRPTKRTIAPSRGVFPQGPGFVARIHHAGKRHYLGYFPTLEAAKAAYETKAKEIHGEFAYAERDRPLSGEICAGNAALSFGA